jgi:hypothetical protein
MLYIYCFKFLLWIVYTYNRIVCRGARWPRQCAWCTIAKAKQRWPIIGWVTKILLSRAPSCFRRHVKPLVPADLQSLAPTNPHWVRVVAYGPFTLCVIHQEGPFCLCVTHKEGLCPSSEEINRLMMIID